MSVQTQIDRITAEVQEQLALMRQIHFILQHKSSSGTTGDLPSGIMAIASGMITPVSDVSGTQSITHNLGVKPDFAFLMIDNDTDPTTKTNMHIWSILFYGPVTQPSGTTYQAIGCRCGINANGTMALNTVTDLTGKSYPATETTINIPVSFTLKTGYAYHWVCGVMEDVL